MAIKSFALGRLEGGSVQLLGTCFLVRPETFATAAHNLNSNDSNLVAIIPHELNDPNSYQPMMWSSGDIRLFPVRLEDIDPVHDIAVLTCHANIIANYPPMPSLASTDTATVGDRVFTLGYPHAQQGSAVM